jgi:hypothetical protein
MRYQICLVMLILISCTTCDMHAYNLVEIINRITPYEIAKIKNVEALVHKSNAFLFISYKLQYRECS